MLVVVVLVVDWSLSALSRSERPPALVVEVPVPDDRLGVAY